MFDKGKLVPFFFFKARKPQFMYLLVLSPGWLQTKWISKPDGSPFEAVNSIWQSELSITPVTRWNALARKLRYWDPEHTGPADAEQDWGCGSQPNYLRRHQPQYACFLLCRLEDVCKWTFSLFPTPFFPHSWGAFGHCLLGWKKYYFLSPRKVKGRTI